MFGIGKDKYEQAKGFAKDKFAEALGKTQFGQPGHEAEYEFTELKVEDGKLNARVSVVGACGPCQLAQTVTFPMVSGVLQAVFKRAPANQTQGLQFGTLTVDTLEKKGGAVQQSHTFSGQQLVR